ncbi:MAG: hypothetical protein WA532_02475 [Candidatus Korobacteraceae bacterium]
MKCNEFGAHIDEMLSGVLHPDANQHMRQCERCTSHYRARAAVQNGLRKLALVSVPGPSPAVDRAVMDAYRQLQQRRTAVAQPQPVQQAAARVLTFPGTGHPPAEVRNVRHWNSRNWWSGASAAAVALAVLGMGLLHLHNGVPAVSAPTVATAPAASAPQSAVTAVPVERTVATAKLASRHSGSQSSAEVTSASLKSRSVQVAKAAPMTQLPTVQAPAEVSPLIHLASAGEAANVAQNVAQHVAQSASSTWPGYSNLMYCDPVVCSGPMQVVHIKVPVDQVKPNVGQSVGNSFVNADVVVGPDGVARAIRVAN